MHAPLRVLTALLVLLSTSVCSLDAIAQQLVWSNLPPVPDEQGFAGPITGVADDKLIVAGGANFPDKKPWEGGAKRWYDTIFILDKPSGGWRTAGRLPRPLGYSVCITTPRGIAVLGGSNQSGHVSDCFWLRLRNGTVHFEPLPPLPQAISNACGAIYNGRLYLAGGTSSPDAVAALDVFVSLDVAHSEGGWRKEPTWPGAARMLATAAVQSDAFYLVGGVTLSADVDGRPQRNYLRDAYKFSPTTGWSRIADLPWPLAASPSPAPAWASHRFLMLGGDDGSQVAAAPQEHTGFRREVLMYDARENKWCKDGSLPIGLVTTAAVSWDRRVVVPGGEARPGVRSTKVLSGSAR